MAFAMRILVLLLFQLLDFAMAATLPSSKFNFDDSEVMAIYSPGCIVVGEWLYIIGGTIQEPRIALRQNQIVAVDLSQSWTADSVVGVRSITGTNETILLMSKPGLWYDGITKEIGAYGGQFTLPKSNLSMSIFTPDVRGTVSNLKEQSVPADRSFDYNISRPKGGLYTSSPTAFYILGGWVSSTTDPDSINPTKIALTSLSVYDFASTTWRNETVGIQKVNGEAQFIPLFGDKGILVAWSGDVVTENETQIIIDFAPIEPVTISIYDIASKTWHQKNVTGNIPLKRANACSVAIGELGSGSYEIYYFGGGLENHTTMTNQSYVELSTVYILSLPSFTWIATDVSTKWRNDHDCTVIGQRQMVSVGGHYGRPGISSQRFDLLEIFDLVDLKWSNKYIRNPGPYTRPAIVAALYKGHGKPKAIVNWETSALQALFQPSTNTTSTGTNTTTLAPGDNNPKNNPSLAGPIAGGVVGGVVAVVSIILFVLWLRRRNQRKQDATATAAMDDANSPSTTKEMDGSGTNKFKIAYHEFDVGNLPQEVDGRTVAQEVDGGNVPRVDGQKFPERKPVPSAVEMP